MFSFYLFCLAVFFFLFCFDLSSFGFYTVFCHMNLIVHTHVLFIYLCNRQKHWTSILTQKNNLLVNDGDKLKTFRRFKCLIRIAFVYVSTRFELIEMQKISDTTTYRRLELICRHVFLHFWEYPLLNRLLLLLLLFWFLSDDNFVVFRFLISLIRLVGTELCLIGLLDKSYVLWWITIWFFLSHLHLFFTQRYTFIYSVYFLMCINYSKNEQIQQSTNKQKIQTTNTFFYEESISLRSIWTKLFNQT